VLLREQPYATISCVSPLLACSQDGNGPLHWASLYGHVEVARLLLEQKAAVNQANKVTMHKS
jgi:ankyrin repeat protein